MNRTVSIALVGIAGYGRTFVNRILDEREGKDIRIVAAIARRPERCERLQELKDAGAALYPSLEEFYGSGGRADLVFISSPIHLHVPHARIALENGSNVYCEKPIAATVQDAEAMAAAERAARGFVAIGYQWSFSDAVQALKRDIMAGLLGAPRRLRTLVFWPRPRSYYRDRGWAAVLKSEEGDWILDSPVQNAAAHFVHNAFYILGPSVEASADPADVQCEQYRVNEIENFDTAALRARTTAGVEIALYVSHAVPADTGVMAHYEFDDAVVTCEMHGAGRFVARFRDGRIKDYGSPGAGDSQKIWKTVEAVRRGAPPLCTIAAAMPQTRCANGAQESASAVVTLPAAMVRLTGDPANPLTWAQGLDAVLIQCYAQGVLPSEHGAVPWARAARLVDLRNYRRYPSL